MLEPAKRQTTIEREPPFRRVGELWERMRMTGREARLEWARVVIGRSLVALVLLTGVPAIHAAKCSDTSGFAAAQAMVDAAAPCGDATYHSKYVKSGKQTLKNSDLTNACRKLFIKERLEESLCGRGVFLICCGVNKQGKSISKVVKGGPCKKGVSCANSFESVGQACTPQGTCVTTTTVTTTSVPTTTSVTTTSSTTTTTAPTCDPAAGRFTFDFTVVGTDPGAPGAAQCGRTRATVDASGPPLQSLHCGGLNVGAGDSQVPEFALADGGTTRLVACCGPACDLFPTEATAPGIDCSVPGCYFGPPIPVVGTATPPICNVNVLAEPSSGTYNQVTGDIDLRVVLTSEIYLFSDPASPCPVCSAPGAPGSPGTGTCDKGPMAGLPCTSYNSHGLSTDCPPPRPIAVNDTVDGYRFLGSIVVEAGGATPLTTRALVQTAADGLFCPGQELAPPDNVGGPGCFGANRLKGQVCRRIETSGVPAPPGLSVGARGNVTLTSIFCDPASGTITDTTTDVPGPGQVSITGEILLSPVP